MKKQSIGFLIISIIILSSSCKKDLVSIINSPASLDSGMVMFYSDDNSVYDIQVMLEGTIVGTLTNTITGIPNCGTPGALTKSYPVGDYQYRGLMNGDILWQGNITVQKNGCTKVFFNKQGDDNIIRATPVDSFFSFKLNNNFLSFKYPWWGHLTGDSYSTTVTTCDPYLGAIKLFFRAHNQYKEPFPFTVPPGACTAGPGGNNTNFEFHLKMSNRPNVGQQFTSCNGQMRFKASISEQANYGFYGIESAGDYITITITSVTGLTISGTFQGSLTRYKTENCQKIILGRGEITNGSFRTKYKFN